MLVGLHVKNMALLKEAEIELGAGLNILTGETGAGKSLIIGSVNIALGTGSFKDYVSEGTDDSLVELIFHTDNREVLAKLDEAGIPAEEGQVILSRKYHNGRSISRVNAETVPLAFVRQLAAGLIDVHGQHEHQSLLYPAFHLMLLDRFAGPAMQGKLSECRTLHKAYRDVLAQLDEAVLDEQERVKQMDLLSYEIREIEQAGLTEGEDEKLEKEYLRLGNARKIIGSLGEAAGLINASDGAGDMLSRAVRLISSVGDVDEQLEQLARQASEAEDLLTDLSRDVSAYLDDFTYDEQTYYETGQRLDEINHLKSKYGKSIDEILSYAEEQQEKLDKLNDYEAYLASLQQQRAAALAALNKKAGEISELRSSAAARLEPRITGALRDLNFLDVQFKINFEKMKEPAANGYDQVCFLISVNPGTPLRPLQDTASGGELSRIMLAIKSVMAGEDQVETLIFDEIDTGISGRTAQKVSEKMAVIAKDHQVICITHLAQIAAMADSHYEIAKETDGKDTATKVRLLDREQSVEELARILGGARITDAVMTSAGEMKEMADKLKQSRK